MPISFNLLLRQGPQADTTEGVPKIFLMHGGLKIKCSSLTPLQPNQDTKVTGNMFKIAASQGNEQLLPMLAEFCQVERVPGKWLDVVQPYGAASRSIDGVLQSLLGRRVEPDVASPDGETPLVEAAWDNKQGVVRMLLAAGALPDGGPTLKGSPMCRAAGYGHYEMVKFLVDAGASIHFRGDQGEALAMLAKKEGRIRIFKNLEQHRVQQEG